MAEYGSDLAVIDFAPTKQFYTYAFFYPSPFFLDDEEVSNVIFYIGKGKGNRAPSHLKIVRVDQNAEMYWAMRLVWERGLKIHLKILGEFDTEEEALLDEKNSIIKFSSRFLTNSAHNTFRKERKRMSPQTQFEQRVEEIIACTYHVSPVTQNFLISIALDEGISPRSALARVVRRAYHRKFDETENIGDHFLDE